MRANLRNFKVRRYQTRNYYAATTLKQMCLLLYYTFNVLTIQQNESRILTTCSAASYSVWMYASENPVPGRGYNILFGNPDGVNPISGGKDPGILQRQILNSNIYTTDSHFNIASLNDSNNLGNTSDTCEKIDTVEWFYGEKTYQEKLLKSFQISDKNIVIPTIWPKGTYALVKVKEQKYGQAVCPSGVRWDSGYVHWCTGDQKNDWSQSQHFAGTIIISLQCNRTGSFKSASNYPLISIDMMFQKQFWNLLDRFIAQSTCNDNTSVQTIANKKNLVIQALNDYNNNASIPQGFSSGYVRWDTKDNSYSRCNQASGYYPSGTYSTDIMMNFCCRNDSDSSIPITLPRDQPFYLVRNNGSKQCQQVNGMTSKEEYITWDNANNSQLYKNYKIASDIHPLVNVTIDFDITMYFCYYHK
ncbi:unnamed protein product [Mytilus edulis]|uniref:Apextrin C-terminal domain-containing protein n=1 Tax=Mytilus edulis TaxID=6550 RepID=A0A8S3SMQ2_MYTED|nr:unnamed protein product [Mytilus edulis]